MTMPANVETGSHPAEAMASPPHAAAESPTEDAVVPVVSALGLTAGDRRFLWVVGSAIVLLSAVHWARLSGWGQQEIELVRLPERRFDFRVDVNRATWVEWMQLEGIGELTARRIVADRDQRGPFRNIDDVDRVPGIGPQTLATIRPWLTCDSDVQSTGPASAPP